MVRDIKNKLSKLVFGGLLFTSALSTLASAEPTMPKPVNSALSGIKLAAKDRYIVEFNPLYLRSNAAMSLASQTSVSEFSPISVVEIDHDENIKSPQSSVPFVETQEVPEVCNNLIKKGVLKSCSPDFIIQLNRTPNDPSYAGKYWHQHIDSSEAWDVTTGSNQVVVAVIDTGIDYNHPDLAANMWINASEIPANNVDDDNNGVIDDVYGYNPASNTGDPFDDGDHGTHVAGIIGAVGNNSLGITGVNWNVKLMALKFISAAGWGFTSDAVKAIDYMVLMKQRGVPVKVSNNSWGGGGFSQPLEDAIERANNAGIIFAAAAGNSASDNDILPQYPANYDVANVVSVAATNDSYSLASFSCFGATTVDIAAPGEFIYSTVPGSKYQNMSGTSMATPFVSGALALLYAAEPNLTVNQAIARLYSSAEPVAELEGLISTGRLLNSANLVKARSIANPSIPQVCDYSHSEIAFQAPLSLTNAETVMPRIGTGYLDNFTLNLPFEFPFYSKKINHLVVSPNGIVYAGDEKNPWVFSSAPFAPSYSIAPLHTPLFDYNIDRTLHGIKTSASPSRVDIEWNFRHYWNAEAGTLKVYLSLFPDGTIESYTSIPNDRLAKVLLYGSLTGIRGDSVVNSLTVMQNGFPIPLRGNQGFRFSRPLTCETIESQPTPVPTQQPGNPNPVFPTDPEPQPSPTPTPGSQSKIQEVKISDAKNKVGIVQAGQKYKVSIKSDAEQTVRFQLAVNGEHCAQDFILHANQGVTSYELKMPVLDKKLKTFSISADNISAAASIKKAKKKSVKKISQAKACGLISLQTSAAKLLK